MMAHARMTRLFTIFGFNISIALSAKVFLYPGVYTYAKGRNIRLIAFNKFSNWTAKED